MTKRTWCGRLVRPSQCLPPTRRNLWNRGEPALGHKYTLCHTLAPAPSLHIPLSEWFCGGNAFNGSGLFSVQRRRRHVFLFGPYTHHGALLVLSLGRAVGAVVHLLMVYMNFIRLSFSNEGHLSRRSASRSYFHLKRSKRNQHYIRHDIKYILDMRISTTRMFDTRYP